MKKHLDQGISRRTLLQGGAASTIILAAPTIITRPAKAADVLYVNTWGGVFTEAEQVSLFTPFTKATGIEVRPVAPVSMAKLKAQVQSNTYDWDVTEISMGEARQMIEENLLEKVDYTVLDKNKITPGTIYKDYSVASTSIGSGLVYRKDKFPNGGPQNWADFWDVKKFPGDRALIDQAYTIIAFALLADGVPRDKLYPFDLDRAFKKLNEIKPHIKVWWKQGAQSEELIRSGEVVMMSMWNGRAQGLIDKGVPLQIVWNGTQVTYSQRFVPKGTPRAKLAWKYIEFASQAQPMAEFAKRMYYGPSNPDSFKYMTAEETAKMPSAPENLKVTYTPNDDYLAPNLAKINERWAQWIAG